MRKRESNDEWPCVLSFILAHLSTIYMARIWARHKPQTFLTDYIILPSAKNCVGHQVHTHIESEHSRSFPDRNPIKWQPPDNRYSFTKEVSG